MSADVSQQNGKAQVRLTAQVKAGGCASKLAPGSLSAVLSRLPQQQSDNLLVGFQTADDAGVYQLSPDLALVQTVDFFTPMVDDPYVFGQIAAANALSDVYAMGGRPMTALSLVCFPQDGDLDVLEQIMRGGLAKMDEAGCIILGGHSVRDQEMKFGYAATGTIHPAKVYTNTGAQPGDALVLTKPIGAGVITTAIKQGKAEQHWVDAAVRSMTLLNRLAAEIAGEFEVHAATDVTGFGLMGHGRELALGSGVRLSIQIAAVPLLDGAVDAVRLGTIPAGLNANREYAECIVVGAAQLPEERRTLMYDPQTSGGLFLSVAPRDAQPLLDRLLHAGLTAALIGEVLPIASGGGPGIELR
jgi:selenide,water dikinase